ncbi:MAG TPA: hypothetical protein VFT43_10515, partial [Candidatus Polarisedimenticolia bacterium]|nr:hypothetical protein [Candidatus Polarisedimenticolia bacterium]
MRRFAIPALWLALALSSPSAAPAAAPAAAAETCLACHSDPTLTTQRRGATVSLHVDPAMLKASVHDGVACAGCHVGLDPDNLPHAARLRPVNCMTCHADAPQAHTFHARLAGATGTDGAPGVSCKGCHGTHDVTPPTAPGGRFHAANLVAGCGRCHEAIARQFADSAHGQSMAAGGQGAPDCLTCHRQPITAARAGGENVEHKIAQEKVCLSCHLDNPEVRARMSPGAGFIAAYEKSVHGAALLADANPDVPNCVSCHSNHAIK